MNNMIIETIKRLSIDMFIAIMAIEAIGHCGNRFVAFDWYVLQITHRTWKQKEIYIETERITFEISSRRMRRIVGVSSILV